MTKFRSTPPAEINIDPWSVRSPFDRRNGTADRRQQPAPSSGAAFGTRDRRREDRRCPAERREGWLRINRWQSVSVFDT
ncbi:MAG: hypothetical protein WAM73_18255 [Desulfobacterales bacterium]